MRRLVESWVEAERAHHGNSLAEAIRRLNENRGMRVTHSRVSEWRRGVYAPSQLVLSHNAVAHAPLGAGNGRHCGLRGAAARAQTASMGDETEGRSVVL